MRLPCPQPHLLIVVPILNLSGSAGSGYTVSCCLGYSDGGAIATKSPVGFVVFSPEIWAEKSGTEITSEPCPVKLRP